MNLEKQQQAHDLYFATGKSQQEIADILDVSRKTINGWIKRNRWDDMKAATRQMPSIILQDIYTHINAINDRIFSRAEADRCPTVQEVGMLHKLLTMTKSIEKKHTGSYIEAFQELQLFIFNRDSALALQLRDQIAAYARGTLGDKEFMARKKRKNNVLDVVATLGRQEQREMNEQETDQECNPNVTSCNPETPTNTHHGNHANQANQGSDNVTFSNPTSGIPHPEPVEGQSVATPPAHHDLLTVQTGCSPSPLAQKEHTTQAKTPTNIHQDNPLTQANHGQECNTDVTFCNPDEQQDAQPKNTSKVFTVAANGEITPPQNTEKCNKENVTQKCNSEPADGVTFIAKEKEGTHAAQHDSSPFSSTEALAKEESAGGVMALPPHMRPSPFIDGDTVWVLDRRHLERRHDTYGNPWGPMKIGYTVRYYPEVDPANNKAA